MPCKTDVEVETERAKERMEATLKKGDKLPVKENLPERETGQSRDLATTQLQGNREGEGTAWDEDGFRTRWKNFHQVRR